MKYFLAFCFLLIFGNSFSQTPAKLEIPQFGKHDTITHHTAYSLSYNSRYRQANWVAYQLTKAETNNLFERDDSFKADPLIKNSDNALDYKKSGFDRGHLAPAADMGFSELTMKESFYYSNMSPQVPSFNRGIWKKLEDKIRDWAQEYDSLYIVTGPILGDSLKSIGPHKISVPNAYFKVILEYKSNQVKAIAFLMSNEASKEALTKFAVTIDQLESLTSFDFFPLLPDEVEQKLESETCLSCWSW